MCCGSPFGVGQFREDVILGVNLQFGVFDVFFIGESAVQCYTKVQCSRGVPDHVMLSGLFASRFLRWKKQAWVLRVGGCACSRGVAHLGLR